MTRLLLLIGLLLALGSAGLSALASAQTAHQWRVTSDGDSGAGTLRHAIESANASDGSDVIRFASAMTIRPQSELPPLADARITIDASSDEASPDVEPSVWLEGSAAGDAAGLEISASGAVVRGLGIGGFARYGIGVIGEAASDAVIEGNWLGFSQGGIAANELSGVAIIAGAGSAVVRDNRIGGNSSSGRTGHGIVVGGSSSEADISGNVIGIAADGSPAPNDDGILIVDQGYATIEGNTVGHSEVAGIELRDTWRVVSVDGNFVGVRPGGELAPNDVGVFLNEKSSGAQIGFGAANVIAGNRVGIAIEQGAREAWVRNNWIGLVPSGADPLSESSLPRALVRPNRERGISVIAGAAVIYLQNNYVSAGDFGIVVDDASTTQVSLTRNVVAGARSVPTEAAIDVRAGTEITIGGGDAGYGNHVCGAEFGIRIAQINATGAGVGQSQGTVVENNAVGAGAASRVTFDSQAEMEWGIRLSDGVVGLRVHDNTIADATRAAISVVGADSMHNLLLDNRYLRNGLDIDLGADGPNVNDPGDRDTGPNGLLNRPEIVEHSIRRISGQQVRSTISGTAPPGSRVYVYVDDGRGTRHLARGYADRSGNWTATTAEAPTGWLRALAHEPQGSTSEFSEWVVPSRRLRLASGVHWFGWSGPDQAVNEALASIERWLDTVWVWRAEEGWRGWSPRTSTLHSLSELRTGDVVRVQLSAQARSVELFVPGGADPSAFDSVPLQQGYNSVTWPGGDAVDTLIALGEENPDLISRVWQWHEGEWQIIWPRLAGQWDPGDWSYPALWITAIRDGVLSSP